MIDNQILPACQPTGALLENQPQPTRRILVVEDDADIRHLNAEALIRSGYAVEGAENGEVAWNSLQINNYDLLITDNGMPRLTGVGLLKKLRAARMTMPVILATAEPPTGEFAQSPWLIPDATLIKPYTITELLGTVKKVLRAAADAAEEIAPRPSGLRL